MTVRVYMVLAGYQICKQEVVAKLRWGSEVFRLNIFGCTHSFELSLAADTKSKITTTHEQMNMLICCVAERDQ